MVSQRRLTLRREAEAASAERTAEELVRQEELEAQSPPRRKRKRASTNDKCVDGLRDGNRRPGAI